MSMMHALKAAGRSFELHYSARRKTDLAFWPDIDHLAGERAHCYASGEPGQARLDLQQILAESAPNAHVYVCGPRPMISAVRDLSHANG